MKSLKFLLVAALAFATMAASSQGSPVYLKTHANKLFNYGRTSTVTTTDNVATNIDLLTISDNEGGILEAQVVGFSDTDSSVVTGSKIVRYAKKAGTLTLGSATSSLAVAADSSITGATFAFAASSNNVAVQVTGVASKTIRWTLVLRRIVLRSS